jgi:hypothetical protein
LSLSSRVSSNCSSCWAVNNLWCFCGKLASFYVPCKGSVVGVWQRERWFVTLGGVLCLPARKSGRVAWTRDRKN